MKDSFKTLKNWLLYSDLSNSCLKNENLGAVHSFFNEKKNKYGFLYPEITGYFISFLRFLNSTETNDNYVEKAQYSANWLLKIYDKFGGIIQGLNTIPSQEKLVYSFDSGICAKGLLDCFLMTKDKKYLIYATKIINWIIYEALDNDGTVKPYKNLQTNQFEDNKKIWYKQKGCLHIKLAIPLSQIYSITGENIYLQKLRSICDNYSNFQNPDGSFSLHLNSNLIHIHSLCYALEGLMHAYFLTKNENYLKSCKNALDWTSKKIQSDGSTFLWFNSRYTQAKTSYHIAQLIRLMILLDALKITNYKSKIKSLTTFLISLQAKSKDPRVNGGFYEEYIKSIFGWKKNHKINSWGSMFAFQAIYWYKNNDEVNSKSIEYLY